MGGQNESGMQKSMQQSPKDQGQDAKPIPTIEFICGCRHGKGAVRVASGVYEATGDVVTGVDAEGFVICPTHHVRRRGWRSIPQRLFRLANGNSTRVEFILRPDYSFGMDYLKAERHVLSQ